MKLIHCGDIHLESPMKKNLSPKRAAERKNELLLTFERMVDYGAKQGVEVILICGDLFDGKNVTKRTVTAVRNCMTSHPEIDFLYLGGNHDESRVLTEGQDPVENLKLFTEGWTSYRYGNIVISGMELNSDNAKTAGETLVLRQEDCNIVMLHGQEADYRGKDKAEVINLNGLKGRYIDYLALGHIHTYKSDRLDLRGTYCYCGCLEGRGFDECGEKGFVMLETDGNKVSHTFVPFASRTVREIDVDISDARDSRQVAECIGEALKPVDGSSLVKVVLTGRVEMDSERNLSYLTKKFEDDYYAFKIYDETGIRVDIDALKHDASLKGEFVRLVLEQGYDSVTMREIMETGIKALAGEEIER